MSPLSNPWLVAAVVGSFLQHLLVLSWPTAEIVFRVTTLNWSEVNYSVTPPPRKWRLLEG